MLVLPAHFQLNGFICFPNFLQRQRYKSLLVEGDTKHRTHMPCKQNAKIATILLTFQLAKNFYTIFDSKN